MDKKPKPPCDTNQLAKLIVASASGDVELAKSDYWEDPAAVALGRKGGLEGGTARADALTAEQRAEIAKKAAAARWKAL